MTERDDNSLMTAGPAWPGGWYVYENGKVDGPLTAEDTFKLGTESSDGKPRLVSRKGFSQWYALKDLSEIFQMTDQMGRKAQQQNEITEAQIAAQGAVARPAEPHLSPKVSRREIRSEIKSGALVDTQPVRVASETILKKIATKTAANLTPHGAAPLSAPPMSTAPATPLTVRMPRPTPTTAAAKSRTKALVMQEYFLARGRLRLGKLRNPWISAFVGMPLTLGVFWAFWMRDLARESAFHASNSDRPPFPPTFLAMIPLIHIYMTYKLAKLVVEMEGQNRYRSVSPAVAMLFSIFPPFAMAYLQDAANRHWLLHVKHSMVKKKAEAPEGGAS